MIIIIVKQKSEIKRNDYKETVKIKLWLQLNI